MALTKVNTDLLADGGKLNGIEAGADVTDTTNVTAAGALMDSELTSIASVKALDQGVATTDSPTFAGLTTSGEITANGGIALGDNDKATFGASDDLQIYHDGSDSYIKDAGAGNLYLDSSDTIIRANGTENSAKFIGNGRVELYYDAVKKFETTSTGIDVTGTATMDGLTVDGATLLQSTAFDGSIQFTDSGSSNRNVLYLDNSDNVVLATGTTAGARGIDLYTNNSKSLSVAEGGDISFYEDTGTTPKFFWDASAESLELTNSAASSALKVTKGNTTGNAVEIINSGESRSIDINHNADGTGTVDDVVRIKDNGTTKFVIDENYNVGIGTSSPQALTHLYTESDINTADTLLKLTNVANTARYVGFQAQRDNASGQGLNILITKTDASVVNALTIDTAANVGINTSSPTAPLHVDAAGMGDVYSGLIENTTTDTAHYNVVRLMQGAAGSATGYIGTGGSTVSNTAFRNAFVVGTQTDSPLVFNVNDIEAMRLVSGNLLVGKTSTNYTNVGAELKSDGKVYSTVSGGTSLVLNRKTNDGDIISFYKDNAAVGSIGTHSGGGTYFYSNSGSDSGLTFWSNVVAPSTSSGGFRDAVTDLGASGGRFKDLYLSGGVYLGGTGAANKLDDYEQGTFTATINGSTEPASLLTRAGY